MFFNNHTEDYTKLCEKLGYSFKSKQLLVQALTRKTAVIEDVQSSAIGYNQRLEFLGDKVIGLAVSSILYTKYPNWQEGQLTQMNSQLTSNNVLSKLADYLGIGKYLVLGQSDEYNNVRDNSKALADSVESLFGAIFIDSNKNLKLIEELILKHWQILGLEASAEQSTEKQPEESVYVAEDEIDIKLIEAVCSGTAKEVECCLEEGAKSNVANITKSGKLCGESQSHVRSALQLTTDSAEAYNKMELLLKYGADPNWQGGYQLIDLTPMPRMASITEFLRIKRNQEYKKYFHKNTVLHLIVESVTDGIIEENEACRMVELLYKHKAKANKVNAQGKTPLQLAYDYQKSQMDQEEFYNDTSQIKLNKLIDLLRRITVTNKPTSIEKMKQDTKNFLHDELADIAFCGLPEEFVNETMEHLYPFLGF